MNPWHERLAATIAAGEPARFVVLFGSAATGSMHADSDVDIGWVPKDPDVPLARELAFQAELTHAAGREVDLVRLDLASTLCKHEVAKHGQLLAGSRSAHVRFCAESIAEFLDYEPALRAAGERFRRRLAMGPRDTR